MVLGHQESEDVIVELLLEVKLIPNIGYGIFNYTSASTIPMPMYCLGIPSLLDCFFFVD